VNRRVIEALIKCGAFDSTGARRAQMMDALDQLMDQATRHQEQEAIGQFSIFDAMDDQKDPDLPNIPEWKENQLLAFEKESIGFYITGHPLAAFQADIKRYASHTTESLEGAADGKEVSICGIIAGMQHKLTKKGDKMAILTLEDLTGKIEVVVFPDLFATASHMLLTDTPLIVAGQYETNEQGHKIKATRLHLLTEVKKRGATRMDISLNATGLTQDDLLKVKDILVRFKGDIPVYLRLQHPSRKDSLISVGRDIRVNPSDQLITEIEAVLGDGAVSLN
jgi:DNA polymerase-3 subunit alpha